MRSLALLLLLSAPARAQIEDEPAPAGTVAPAVPMAAPPIPDPSYRAVLDRTVILRTRSGGEVTGRILAFDGATVSLAVAPSQSVITLDRMDVVGLRLEAPPLPPPIVAPTPPAAAAVAERPGRERHFGLHLGLAPAITLDVDYKLFYGFFNASLVLPMASDGDLAGFSVGGGLNFPVSRGSAWKFEVFTYLASARLAPDWIVGFGFGIGLHYTFRSGFAIGFKAPILGYSFGGGSHNGGEAVAMFYLSSAMGLPLMSIGYRF